MSGQKELEHEHGEECGCEGCEEMSDYDDDMACPNIEPFGFMVKPKKFDHYEVPSGVVAHITGVALSAGNDSHSRHVVELWHGKDLEDKQVIARLIPGVVEQATIDIALTAHAGPFSVALIEGSGSVDVIGYFQSAAPEFGDSDSENEGDDGEETTDAGEEEEVSEETYNAHQAKIKHAREVLATMKTQKEGDSDEDEYEEQDMEDEEEEEPPMKRSVHTAEIKEALTAASKKEQKKEKEKEPKAAPKAEPEAKPATSATKDSDAPKGFRNLRGVWIKDVTVGNGPQVKQGKTVTMSYILRLNDDKGKILDKSSGGNFSFRLGGGSVVAGVDIGVTGMKVGGRRSMIIPANLGYGSRGTGPIPANATLHFDVELFGVSK